MPKRIHRIVGRAPLAILLLLVTLVATACEPTGGIYVNTGGSRFVVEAVEMGVRFDEPVVIDGAIVAVGPAQSASVMLEQSDEDESFSASLGATDTSGNASQTHLEVRLDPST